jgi:hypothetical protein
MLSDAIRQQARTAIQSRFHLRDEVLHKELEQLAAKTIDRLDAEDVSKLNIRLRLICEHDLYERAFIIWNNLKKAHEECGGMKSNGLIQDFLIEARMHMQDASLNLADHLKKNSDALAPAFQGRGALNADWLASLRSRALERYTKDMEEYIEGLSWGIRSVISNMRT